MPGNADRRLPVHRSSLRRGGAPATIGGAALGAVADDHGRFAIDGRLPGDYQLTAEGDTVLPSAPVMVKLAGKPVDDVHLVVRPGARIRGRVDPAGLAEVRISREPHGDPMIGAGLLTISSGGSTLTASDGTFAIGPVAPGEVVLEARAADGRRGAATVQVAPSGAEGVVIHLDDKAGIAGRVLGDDGKPIPNAVVAAHRQTPGHSATIIVNGVDQTAERAPCAADGRFALAGLDAGAWELSVLDGRNQKLAFHREPAPITLRENERKTGVELSVDVPDGVIQGTAVDNDGKPITDAWITAVPAPDERVLGGLPPPPGAGAPPPGDQPPGAHTESRMVIIAGSDGDDDGDDGAVGHAGGGIPPVLTDTNGRFALRGLEKGAYRLMGKGEKGAARGRLDGVATGSDVTLRLEALGQLGGQVSADGKAVTQFSVELDGPTHRQQVFHPADGRFLLARVDPGHYTVHVTSPSGSGNATVDVVAGQPAEVKVALVSHAHLTGRVVDAAGQPMPNVPVVAADAPKGGGMRISIEGEPPHTGADGRFALEVAPGPHMIVVLTQNGPQGRKPVDAQPGQAIDAGDVTVKP